MNLKTLAATAALAICASPVWAASPVTCTGGVMACAAASDDFIPLQGTPWTETTAFWAGIAESVTVDLGGTVNLGQVFAALDNNDAYLFETSLDGTAWAALGTVAIGDGGVAEAPGGMDWFTSAPGTPFSVSTLAFAPVQAAFLRVRATGGDSFYSVGEINWSAAAAVPEPGSLALMLAGAAGLIWRRRSVA